MTHLGLLLLYLFVGLFMLALMMFYCEKGHNPKFETLGDGIWWAVITITTVGYGHQVPITVPGKIVACCAFLFGIVAIGLPIHPVISNFTMLYKRHREVKNAFELATKRHEIRELEKEKLLQTTNTNDGSCGASNNIFDTSSKGGGSSRRDSLNNESMSGTEYDFEEKSEILQRTFSGRLIKRIREKRQQQGSD